MKKCERCVKEECESSKSYKKKESRTKWVSVQVPAQIYGEKKKLKFVKFKIITCP